MAKQKRFVVIETPRKLMSTIPFDNTKNTHDALYLH